MFPGLAPIAGQIGKIKASGNDAYTTLLVHCDGSNGATTFSDVSASANTLTANGATVSTSDPRFGTGCALFDGSSAYIAVPRVSGLILGSGDFTIDAWFNRAGGDGTVRTVFGRYGTSKLYKMGLNASDQVAGYVSTNGTNETVVTGTTAITATGWHHIALVRDTAAGLLRIFLDGAHEGAVALTGTVNDGATAAAIGRKGGVAGEPWNGAIDEVRVSLGIARWTAAFTPPGRAYG